MTVGITADLVGALVRQQFPRWAGLPVTPVPRQGWDNRTFRLGAELVVRLPSAAGYAAAVAKEDRWLPRLAPHLPRPVPVPVAVGRPGAGYPFPWSVRRWLPGTTVQAAGAGGPALARDLGVFLTALRAAPAAGGPAAGPQSNLRGCHPGGYAAEVAAALTTLAGSVDAAACRAVWARATASAWAGPPVWFHGDVAAGNLLTAGDGLAAVIDFGQCGVGDPACDLVPAWTVFTGAARAAFRAAAGLPADAWARARGWALWKCLITLAGGDGDDPAQRAVLAAVLTDPVAG